MRESVNKQLPNQGHFFNVDYPGARFTPAGPDHAQIASVNGVIDYDYTIKCHFYPNESWYDKTRASAYILKHEQTHFDISELHARILRKRISEASFSRNVKTEIRALYEAAEVDRRIMQNRFDSESEHSKNKELEYKWEAFVADQLRTYERFK